MSWFDSLRGPEFQRWAVENASGRTVRQGQRLDPFATSMRDFKAVSGWLDSIASNRSLPGDEAQHLVDLRAADLVNSAGALTPLGSRVCELWAAEKVNDSLENHELIRCLSYIVASLDAGNESVTGMQDFWIEARDVFSALRLLNAPVTIYFISYLNTTTSGYNPWDRVRAEGPTMPENPLPWLEGEAGVADGMSSEYTGAVEVLRKRVVDFSTRSSGRVTFCKALEITSRPLSEVPEVLHGFGQSDLLTSSYSILGRETSADDDQRSAPTQQRPRPASSRRARAVNRDAPKPWSPDPSEDADVEEKRMARLLKAERANTAHHAATLAALIWLEDRRFEVTELDYDLLAIRGPLCLLIEVKSINERNERRQTITAIGQLAYYRAHSIPAELRSAVTRIVLFDHKPRSTDSLETLTSESIVGAWIDETQDIAFSQPGFAESLNENRNLDEDDSLSSTHRS